MCIAPSLFASYLTAILEVAFKDSDDGIYVQSRPDGDLFKTSQFKARTLTNKILVREMLFADDNCLAQRRENTVSYK